MTFWQKYYAFTEKLLTLAVLILVFEFSFPHNLVLAQEVKNSNNLGPTIVQLKDPLDSYMTRQVTLSSLPEIANKKPRIVRWVTVTAYSSTVDQCDSTPFITANGKWVYDGLVAANFLYFGTNIRFPDYFNNKIFTVDDRMNSKYQSRIDIWMPDREQAKEFGVRYLKVEIY
ncbi:3D domain-containing protein [Candidatus Parcubacteria bacterium]|nr:3D domain-containing protein [Patescibacteria group bacterium]MBU4481898.1 3D domain-containing protein [Patescibacteria group bacterium]MCG2686621.1 3D domain-containing protein [Candidatus Parcubacteria bacterium]